MVGHRDRHGRGVRGPLALPNAYTRRPAPLPGIPTLAQRFLTCLEGSIARINQICPEALVGVDIGFEDVPSAQALWGEAGYGAALVPLAAAIDADDRHPARIVVYRRPIERRSTNPLELARLVHQTLVEQLAILTGRSAGDIDPDFDADW